MKHYIAIITELSHHDGYMGHFPGLDGLSFTNNGFDGLQGAIAQATRYLHVYAKDKDMPEPLEPTQMREEVRNGNRVFFVTIPLLTAAKAAMEGKG